MNHSLFSAELAQWKEKNGNGIMERLAPSEGNSSHKLRQANLVTFYVSDLNVRVFFVCEQSFYTLYRLGNTSEMFCSPLILR